MSWLIFAACLLFVSAVDSYFTRRREARARAHTGAHATGSPPAPAPQGPPDAA